MRALLRSCWVLTFASSSLPPAQYEEAGRIEKLGDGALPEIKNYIEIPFLCGD